MTARISQPLVGQNVIVTGGASGIGRSACLSLAGKGAAVVVVDINSRDAEETAHQLKAQECPVEPIVISKDIGSEEQMEEMARIVEGHFGRIDSLVHCAGILRGKNGGPKLMAEVSLAEWDEVIKVNLKGTFLCNRAVLPAMMKQRRGQIVNISSTSGLRGRAFDSVYCASKFGVVGMSQSLMEEVRQYGIKVHVILPDAVNTPMWDQNGPIPAPDDALSPTRVADLIAFVLTLPEDTMLGELVIAPFKTRRRKKRDPGEGT
jgi:NAD(P)-dependent dehydrogenase (short-subunit alcohol dehydrogenase family)